MKIEIEEIPNSTIEDFADQHDLEMKVTERPPAFEQAGKYYASFKNCEVSEGGLLLGAIGNGATPERAIQNYALRISMKRIVINANADRTEIDVPRLIVKP